ncbi:MAG: hypothetical protein IT454_16165 [Planctomycetes bacterium]|nr:hypothetical protein [Planctomycetota bacterium]
MSRRVSTRALHAALALLAGSTCVFLGVACDDDEPQPGATRAWPAGTAVAIDDVAISATQVDLDSVYVERLEQSASPAQLRRLALTNISIPRVLASALAPQKREAALAEARAARSALDSGTFAGPPRPEGTLGALAEGDWTVLGLVVWGTAMDLPDGVWSEVVEEPGRFAILRRLGRRDGAVPMATVVKIEALVFPWLDETSAAQDIEAEHDRHRLTIVDPAWEAIVPELLKYRMGGKQP